MMQEKTSYEDEKNPAEAGKGGFIGYFEGIETARRGFVWHFGRRMGTEWSGRAAACPAGPCRGSYCPV